MHRLLWILAISLLAPNAFCGLTVVLVRHAEVVRTSSDPPLSPQGRTRAKLLASMLRDAHIDAVYASEFVRTQQTAQPAADLFHLSTQKIAGASVAPLVDALRRLGSGTALVVGHSNTIPAIISALGGPQVHIAETAFDNLFVLTMEGSAVSLLRLHYGSDAASLPSPGMRDAAMLNMRTPVMKIDFVKSGGFAGALRNVKATINLTDDGAEVSSGAAYRRRLTPEETSQIRAGADPGQLAQAANQIKARTTRAADLDHYQITITTDDGKTHNIDFNTSGASNQLQGLSPAVVNLVHWLRQESKNILAQRAGAK